MDDPNLNCNGCGESITTWPEVFRCVTRGCERVYHQSCLLTHCAVEAAEANKKIAELKAEIARLKIELDSYKPYCSRGAVIGESIGVKP